MAGLGSRCWNQVTTMARIFVFGSNKRGVHGAGAALTARQHYGAVPGVGRGRTGNAWAIPTKAEPSRQTRQLPLDEIRGYVREFLEYARAHPTDTFEVTRVGCGLAGYHDREIAPMFAGHGPNVELPGEWRALAEPEEAVPVPSIKAITIDQPFASAIASGEKRVENRYWCPSHRGWLAIHAGRTTRRFEPGDKPEPLTGLRQSQMPFGAVVAVARLVACLPVDAVRAGRVPPGLAAWLPGHPHAKGPQCWVLDPVWRLNEPVKASGQQGLWAWTPPVPVEQLVRERAVPVGVPGASSEGGSLLPHGKITVVNLHAVPEEVRSQPGFVYCGRPGPLGNPWSHLRSAVGAQQVGTREEAIARFWQWAVAEMATPEHSGFARLIAELRDRYRAGEYLVLGCWCEPSPCHARVIAALIRDEQPVVPRPPRTLFT